MVSEPFVERARCGSQRGVKSVVWFCDRGERGETRIIVKDAKSIEFEMESLAFECVEVEREILVA